MHHIRNFFVRVLVLSLLFAGLLTTPTHAACECTVTYTDGSTETLDGVETTFFDDCFCSGSKGSGILTIVMLIINIMSGIVLTAAILGVTLTGVQYLSAMGDEARITKAKNRLFHIILGLIVFALGWSGLNWLVPGGLFHPEVGIASSEWHLKEEPDQEQVTIDKPNSPQTSIASKPASKPTADKPAATKKGVTLSQISPKVTDPESAIVFLRQYITDTNSRYGTNYALPTSPLPVFVDAGGGMKQAKLTTPGSHSKKNCWNGVNCGDCMAFTRWFVTEMTDNSFGLNYMSSVPALKGWQGQYPEGYAVFHVTGHGGIVVGWLDSDTMITVENNLNNDGVLGVRLHTKANFRNASFFPIKTSQLKFDRLNLSSN